MFGRFLKTCDGIISSWYSAKTLLNIEGPRRTLSPGKIGTIYPCDESIVSESIMLVFLASTNKLNVCKKSTPMIGWLTLAVINDQVNVLCKLRSRVRRWVPYVRLLDHFQHKEQDLHS